MLEISFAPLAFSFALLVFWTGLGWSLIATIERRMQPLKAMFLAPVLGAATTLLPVFWLNHAGLPVGSFARPLAAVFCCVIVLVWLWHRPSWTWRELAFAIPVIAAIVVVGFPTLRFGFDWVGNANADWGTYNLSAIRYLSDGFYQEPSIDAMRAGRDYPGLQWFADVAGDGRLGAQLLLAWTSALVDLNPFFVSMSLIMALHGTLCLTSAGLAMSSIKQRRALFAALILAAIAPLSLFAVHQQLMAQVGGLAFMCALACLVFVPLHELRSGGRMVLASITAAAHFLIYPETVPFVAVAFLLFHFSHLREADWGWKGSWRILTIPLLTSVLLGTYAIGVFFFLVPALHQSATQGIYDGASIFPYFLVPSGLAVLFGLSPLGATMSEPWLSLSIAGGILLLAVMSFGALLGLKRRYAISSFLVVIALVTAAFVVRNNNFGLFKIAMFVQPFIWFAIVVVLMRARKLITIASYALILLAIAVTDIRYTQTALRDDFGGGNAISGASRDRLLTAELSRGPEQPCDVNFDTPIPPLIQILGASRGCARSFAARQQRFIRRTDSPSRSFNPLHDIFGIAEFVERAKPQLSPKEVRLSFAYDRFGAVPVVTFRPQVEYARTARDGPEGSIFNEQEKAIADPTAVPPPRENHLVYLNSNLGSHHYLPDLGATSIFATERDPLFANGKIAAIGRYLLFKVDSPAKSVRLVLDLTTSILGDGSAKLPLATVVGDSAVALGLLGHGAARVVSPAFSPLIVDGVAYVLLDLGVEPKFLNVPRTGLMKLYGTKVSLDYRRMVAFARQIRLIDADAPDSPYIPSRIDKFPSDLAKRQLEFSGLYEDGWMGDEGFVVLHADSPGRVVFRGVLPIGLGLDSVELALTVQGNRPILKQLKPGPFEVVAPAGQGKSRIGFHFSAIGRLPSGDGRPAVALLSSVAIEPGDTISPEPAISVDLPKVLQGVGVDSAGVFLDGWIARNGLIVLNSAQPGTALLRGMVPGNIGLEDQEIEIISGTVDVVRKKLPPGQFEIEVLIEAGRSKLTLAFSRAADLPYGDGRNVAALLQSITVVPRSNQ